MAKLHAYMSYSRNAGQFEGAALVFHFTAREARKLAYQHGEPPTIDDWLDMAVKRIWSEGNVLPLADREKLERNEPHLVWSPPSCMSCEYWGCGIEDDGECCSCGEFAGEVLVEKFKNYYGA